MAAPQSISPETGSILTIALERDAARFEAELLRRNFNRLIFIAAAGWLLVSAAVFAFMIGVSSSRQTRDSKGVVNGAPPPIFQRVQ